MDPNWARTRLQELLDLLAEYLPVRYEASGPVLYQRILGRWPTAERVLQQLVPNALAGWTIGSRQWETMLDRACRLAIGVLDDMDEVEQQLGRPAPRATLDQLHPWVWDAARTFWTPDGYRVAVAQAAAALTAHVQQKVNRWDVADDALMGEVFSDKPAELGKPRLRLPGLDGDKTQESRQRGARSLAQGSYWALRNPATHQVEPWTAQLAVEALCTFSVVARLVEECEVVAVSP